MNLERFINDSNHCDFDKQSKTWLLYIFTLKDSAIKGATFGE